MIAFHNFFSFVFKSFKIDWEVQLLQKIYREWFSEVVIIKRSWIFFLFNLWNPILFVSFLTLSSYFSFYGIIAWPISYVTAWTLLVTTLFFLITQFYYIYHFKTIHQNVEITSDFDLLIKKLKNTDKFFIRFFNWSFFFQLIILAIFFEWITLIFGTQTISSLFFIVLELLCLLISSFLLTQYRKKILDLEMDYNIVVKWKIYFANQTWFLSQVQIIESDKIKSIQAIYPNTVAWIFDVWTIHILTEWDDTHAMGTMSMFYVQSPEKTVQTIQKILSKQ